MLRLGTEPVIRRRSRKMAQGVAPSRSAQSKIHHRRLLPEVSCETLCSVFQQRVSDIKQSTGSCL